MYFTHFNKTQIKKMAYYNSIDRLIHILEELREKCPWDKKQTIHSLSTQTIEELYELTDAIIHEDWEHIKEEIGDLLLHLLFYSKIASEGGHFGFEDVIENICNKLVARHPHIYDTLQLENETEVKKNWERLKLKEGKKSVLEGVPNSLPALVKAYRLQDKAKQVGFDWDEATDVFAKIKEEIAELEVAMAQKNKAEMTAEMGDVLFSIINFARHLDINPEQALEQTNIKFKNRFQKMETLILEDQKALATLALPEMDEYWNKAKQLLASK